MSPVLIPPRIPIKVESGHQQMSSLIGDFIHYRDSACDDETKSDVQWIISFLTTTNVGNTTSSHRAMSAVLNEIVGICSQTNHQSSKKQIKTRNSNRPFQPDQPFCSYFRACAVGRTRPLRTPFHPDRSSGTGNNYLIIYRIGTLLVRNKKEQKKKKKSAEQLVDVPEGWREPEFTKQTNPKCVISSSSFATLFPKYREFYLKECWPLVKNALLEYGIDAELDLVEGSMRVSTTKKTWDPYIIVKARDVLRLLSRSVPYQQAVRVLKNDVACDVIKIGSMVIKRDRFVKRRQRLVGPNGSTLKAIELLTNCYVMVQGNTVSAVGQHRGLKEVRKIVTECMRNIHPIYNIKTLMIKKELAKDPELRNESWDRFLPTFKPKNISKRKQPRNIKKKKDYTPFPPEQPESKVDQELATGEYFLKEQERRDRKLQQRRQSQKEAEVLRIQKRAASYKPPQEPTTKKTKTTKGQGDKSKTSEDVAALKKKLKKSQSQKHKVTWAKGS